MPNYLPIPDLGKRRTMITLDSRDFEKAIKRVYEHRFSFPADQECGNDSSHDMGTFRKEPLDDYEQQQVEKFVHTGQGMFLAHSLLQDMVNHGVLPEGEYLIQVCW